MSRTLALGLLFFGDLAVASAARFGRFGETLRRV